MSFSISRATHFGCYTECPILKASSHEKLNIQEIFQQHVVFAEKKEDKPDMNTSRAMYGVGVMYYNGQGVPRDLEKALTWYRKAANYKISNISSMAKIAEIYINEKIPNDYELAFSWLILAHVISSSPSTLENIYRAGEYFYKEKEYSFAFRCFDYAARKNHVESVNYLALLYKCGYGTVKNLTQQPNEEQGAKAKQS
jgi:uncharacterized protein